MQLYPPLILGLYWPRFSRGPALAGLVAGTLSVGGLMLAGQGHLWVMDVGLFGFLINGLVCVGAGLFFRPNKAEERRVQDRFFTLFDRAAQALIVDTDQVPAPLPSQVITRSQRNL